MSQALDLRQSGLADRLFSGLVRALLYAVAFVFYLQPVASVYGVAAACLLGAVGMWFAGAIHRRRVRAPVLAAAAVLFVFCGIWLADWLLNLSLVASTLGVEGALIFGEVLTFGVLAFFVVATLRALSERVRALALLEVLFVAASVVIALSAHRNRMVNRPRGLSDWAWSLGIDPTVILIAIGLVATLLAVFLFLREQPLVKLLVTLLLLVATGFGFFAMVDQRIEAKGATDALGLSKRSQNSQGGSRDDPFRDNYDQQGPPEPVAVAIFRDDFQTKDPVIYFRQRALSRYNGHHLVADERVDSDVITSLPDAAAIASATPVQSADNHSRLPTTMFLLVDHPQPPALVHAEQLRLVENPNPQRFVAAYEVISQVPVVEPRRLLGRRSVPTSWSRARRQHYLATPDDPRYRALADIIVRDVDPRFFHDDLARAYAIKRYLEKSGFYTLRSKHSSSKDPTASFLFGSLRGYCVHFAHAAVYLIRTQGIAARVALGYAVQVNKRSGGSSLLIMGNRAHAWPEIFVEGVGWVTFDVYPERTDMPPPSPVDYDLEKLLGELARKDPTAGVSEDGKALVIPWRKLLKLVALVFVALLLLAYGVKVYRRMRLRLARGEALPRLLYVGVLDTLADMGLARRYGESRERFARRLQPLSVSFDQLTSVHLAVALGSSQTVNFAELRQVAREVHRQLRKSLPLWRRALGFANPLGWLWVR